MDFVSKSSLRFGRTFPDWIFGVFSEKSSFALNNASCSQFLWLLWLLWLQHLNESFDSLGVLGSSFPNGTHIRTNICDTTNNNVFRSVLQLWTLLIVLPSDCFSKCVRMMASGTTVLQYIQILFVLFLENDARIHFSSRTRPCIHHYLKKNSYLFHNYVIWDTSFCRQREYVSKNIVFKNALSGAVRPKKSIVRGIADSVEISIYLFDFCRRVVGVQ